MSNDGSKKLAKTETSSNTEEKIGKNEMRGDPPIFYDIFLWKDEMRERERERERDKKAQFGQKNDFMSSSSSKKEEVLATKLLLKPYLVKKRERKSYKSKGFSSSPLLNEYLFQQPKDPSFSLFALSFE